jgi:hypothetical protein
LHRLPFNSANAVFEALELDGDLVNRSNFPLPNLARNLRRIQDKIHNGIGFFIIRGLDLKKYTVEDGLVIFLGVQSYIAECRARQDDVGNMIGDSQIWRAAAMA